MPPSQNFVVVQNWPFGKKISLLAPKKPPDSVKSLKWAFCSYLATGGHWMKKQQMNITTLVQLFSIHMISIPPKTSARHPQTTSRHPQTLSRHSPDTPDIGVFAYERALEERAIAASNDSYSTVFNLYDTYTTQDICQTPLHIIQTPPDTIQTPLIQAFSCIRKHWKTRQLLNVTTRIQLFSIYMTPIPPKTSARHPKTSSRLPQTLSRHP